MTNKEAQGDIYFSPATYARGLAYLGDPAKIQNRTLWYWGKSPSLERIRGFVDERERERNRAIAHSNRSSALKGAGKFPEL